MANGMVRRRGCGEGAGTLGEMAQRSNRRFLNLISVEAHRGRTTNRQESGRNPSRPGSWTPRKAEYICADQTVILSFRLQLGGGPYMPIWPNKRTEMNELTLANRASDWHRLKALVLDSVSSPITRRVYNLGLDEFIAWYGQAPRHGFTKAAVSGR